MSLISNFLNSKNYRYTGEGNIPEVIDELSTRAKNIDPLEVAIEVFDSATTMANNGNIDDAVPLYLHVSFLFFSLFFVFWFSNLLIILLFVNYLSLNRHFKFLKSTIMKIYQ